LSFVPPVQFNDESFSTTDDEGDEYWSEKGLAFGAGLVTALLRLDRDFVVKVVAPHHQSGRQLRAMF